MYEREHLLKSYVFAAPDGMYALALGNGSIYNHSAHPKRILEISGWLRKSHNVLRKKRHKKRRRDLHKIRLEFSETNLFR